MQQLSDEEPTNTSRAARVTAILEQYKAHQLRESGQVGRDDLVDLLTDIRHYCDATGLALTSCERQANLHYRAENPDASPAPFAKHIKLARQRYAAPSDNDLEIDDDPDISEGDNGVWVSAWVWVRNEDIEGGGQE